MQISKVTIENCNRGSYATGNWLLCGGNRVWICIQSPVSREIGYQETLPPTCDAMYQQYNLYFSHTRIPNKYTGKVLIIKVLLWVFNNCPWVALNSLVAAPIYCLQPLQRWNILVYKPWRPKDFFQFEILVVLVSSFRFIWIPMLRVYGHYNNVQNRSPRWKG